MNIVGIDPSCKSTGLVYWNGDSFTYKCFKLDLRKEKTFSNVWYDSVQQVSNIMDWISCIKDNFYVYGEVPPPSGMYSPGLYGLDFLLYSQLSENSYVEGIWNFYPNYLGYLHGNRGYKKSDSVKLFTMLAETMGFSVPKINADTAEAGLFCLRGMVAQQIPEVECLRDVYPRLFEEKEKNLI